MPRDGAAAGGPLVRAQGIALDGLWLAETQRLWLLGNDSTAHRLRSGEVLRPGVTRLTAAATDARTVAPRYAQGGAVRPGEQAPYLTASLSTCGVLVTPDGERVRFAPGVEGSEFADRRRLGAVLESGARAYQREGRPLTPMLARFDVAPLLDDPRAACGW